MTATQVLLWILGSFATIAASAAAARLTGRSSEKVASITTESSERVAEITAEGEAFLRAERIYKGALEQLQDENKSLRDDITELKTENRELRVEIGALRRRLDQMDGDELPARVDELEHPADPNA